MSHDVYQQYTDFLEEIQKTCLSDEAESHRNAPPAKQCRVELLHSPTPSSEEESHDADNEEEEPEEPDYATEHSTT